MVGCFEIVLLGDDVIRFFVNDERYPFMLSAFFNIFVLVQAVPIHAIIYLVLGGIKDQQKCPAELGLTVIFEAIMRDRRQRAY